VFDMTPFDDGRGCRQWTRLQRAARVVLAALLLATALPVVAGAQTVIYHRGNSADPETLDPHKTSTVYEAHILRDLFEGLVIHDAKGEVIPGVAEKWTVSADGLVYTFNLREAAKWSNGAPVKASDFVFAYRRIMNPETGAKYAKILYAIKGAEAANKGKGKVEDIGVVALDDRTLKITLERPTTYFLELLTHQTALPLNEAAVMKHGSAFVKPENWVSNGAYVLREVVPGSHVRTQKNPLFHAAASVKIDGVMFYSTKDTAAAIRRFEAGELHSNDDLPADQIKALTAKFGDQIRLAPFLGTYYLAVNTTKPPFNDVRVRQALSMAIDREYLAEQIWGGTMVPGYSFVPPGIASYGEPVFADYKEMTPAEREEQAKVLLAEAGFDAATPLKVEIRFNMTDNNRATVVAIADQWKRLGIVTTQIHTDAKTHFAHLRDGGDFDVARAGWIADYADPQSFLFLLESDAVGLNYAKYKDLDYDDLMRKAAIETNAEERTKVLHAAEAIFMRDLPYIPVLYYGSKNIVSRKLQGWQPNLKDVHPTRFLSLVK
jgi:oligopeptide transport system substrate-binding protein